MLRIVLTAILVCALHVQSSLSVKHINSERLLQQSIVPFSLVQVSTNGEMTPSLAALFNGGFVLVFGGPSGGISAQLYNNDGTPYGAQLQVDTAQTGLYPFVLSLPDGKFVIAWMTDPTGHYLNFQLFNPDGTKSGASTQINSDPFSVLDSNMIPDIVVLTMGKFVIAWQYFDQSGNPSTIAQLFNADWTKDGTYFEINAGTTPISYWPTMTILATGQFVVTWQVYASDGDNFGVYAQIFNGDGTKSGSQFLVNSITAGIQQMPAIATLTTGQFVIVWDNSGSGSISDGVYAQIFNTDSTRSGSEIQVSSDQTDPSSFLRIVSTAGGGFVILFAKTSKEIYARIYGAGGTATGQEFALGIFSSTLMNSFSSILLQNGLILAAGSNNAFTGLAAISFCASSSPVSDTSCFTCSSSTHPYLYNLQCFATCPTIASKSYQYKCYDTCPTEAPYLYDQECCTKCPPEVPRVQNNVCTKSTEMVVITNAQKFASGAVAATSAMNASNSFFVLLASLANMFLYIRYMKINYPDNVKVLFVGQDVELFSIRLGFEVPSSIEDGLPNRSLPDVFEQYNVQSSFLENLWSPMMTLTVVMAATLVIVLLELFTRRSYRRINAVFKKLSSISKWNMPLLVICGNYCDVIFYLSMEFRTLRFDSGLSVCSFVTCVLMIVICVLVILKTFLIVRSLQQSKINKRLKKNWKDYTLLYEEYKQDSYFTLAYLLIFFDRDTVFNLLIANAFDYPLLQAIVMVSLSVTMILYLIFVRPFKSILQFIQIFGNEIMLLMLNSCVLILAILDERNFYAIQERNNIGEVLIILNLIFSSVNLVFMFTGIFQSLVEIFKKYKATKAKKLNSVIEIIKYVLQSEPESKPQSKTTESVRGRHSRLNLTFVRHETNVIQYNIANISSSQLALVDSPDSLLNRRKLQRKPNISNSTRLNLSHSNMNTSNEISILSPEKGPRVNEKISKSPSVMQKAKLPIRDQMQIERKVISIKTFCLAPVSNKVQARRGNREEQSIENSNNHSDSCKNKMRKRQNQSMRHER